MTVHCSDIVFFLMASAEVCQFVIPIHFMPHFVRMTEAFE